MGSINKAIVVGNLGRDPETRYTPAGECVCHINVATSEKRNDKASGERKEITEWHRVVLFRKLGEIAAEYLKKGAQVYIEGRLQTRKWTDSKGVDHYTTEIVGDHMQMLGSRSHDTEHDERGVNDGSDNPAEYVDTVQQQRETPVRSTNGNGYQRTQRNSSQLFADEIPF